MHTYFKDDCLFHHDGAFDGAVLIVRDFVEARTTSSKILALVREYFAPSRPDGTHNCVVRFPGHDSAGQVTSIGVSLATLRSLVADRYVRPRLLAWLEQADDAALLGLLGQAETGLTASNSPGQAGVGVDVATT